jgi:hypothetical protein
VQSRSGDSLKSSHVEVDDVSSDHGVGGDDSRAAWRQSASRIEDAKISFDSMDASRMGTRGGGRRMKT